MANVMVYAFTKHDIALDTEDPRPKATREAAERIGAALIEASAEEVDESLLDGNGFYKPET